MIAKEVPETPNDLAQKAKRRPLPIAAWLSELEARTAKEFQRQTGLDYQLLLQHIIENLDPHPGMQVLELAAGTGLIARHLTRVVGASGRIVGVDISKEMIERARLDAQSAKISSRIEWKVANSDHLPFRDQEFDLVVCGLAFDQPEPRVLMREACRLLVDGGLLLFASELGTDDTVTSVTAKLRSFFNRSASTSEKPHRLTSEELTRDLGKAGFRQVLVRSINQNSTLVTRKFALIRATK